MKVFAENDTYNTDDLHLTESEVKAELSLMKEVLAKMDETLQRWKEEWISGVK